MRVRASCHPLVTLQLVLDRTSFSNARARCQYVGGDLATAQDTAHRGAAYQLLYDADVQAAWLGLRDVNNSDHFIWVDGRSTDSFHNWAVGQPRHSSQSNDDAYDCGVMHGSRPAISTGVAGNLYATACDDIGQRAVTPPLFLFLCHISTRTHINVGSSMRA